MKHVPENDQTLIHLLEFTKNICYPTDCDANVAVELHGAVPVDGDAARVLERGDLLELLRGQEVEVGRPQVLDQLLVGLHAAPLLPVEDVVEEESGT